MAHQERRARTAGFFFAAGQPCRMQAPGADYEVGAEYNRSPRRLDFKLDFKADHSAYQWRSIFRILRRQ